MTVYYSMTGNTRKLAKNLAAKLGSDIEEIKNKNPRKGKIGFMMSGFEAVFGLKTENEKISNDLTDYDLIIIGTPVWAGRVSSPVGAFLKEYGKGLKKVAFFCSKGGGNHEKVFSTMEDLSGKNPAALLAVAETEDGKKKIESFVSRLKKI